jgi:tRNA U34 5-carboxymethylaminomethyl modifying GTPase MnmE/TrmE
LLIGASNSGKSSLINYLAGAPLAPVGDLDLDRDYTKENKSYEVYLLNMKLRIFDTLGFIFYENFWNISDEFLASIKF